MIEESLETFVCESSPCRPSATVTWYRSGDASGETPISGNVFTNYSLAANGLNITKSTLNYIVTRVDHGYTIHCEATNVVSEDVESTRRIMLNVWCEYDETCLS